MIPIVVQKKISGFAREDIAGLDITSALLKESNCTAFVRAGEGCTLAGIEEASFLFSHFGVKTAAKKRDGSKIKKGSVVLRVTGSNKKILSLERTALNLLGRMSGVATICSRASKVAGKKTRVFLTRKTMPGLNWFDKKACVFGGVSAHRKNLRESFLIKDNHLEFESIPLLLQKARERKKKSVAKEIEIEVQNSGQALIAAQNGPDVILLDNFSPKNAKKAIQKIRQSGKKIKIELSGGINLNNLKQYVSLGADRVSMGELTKRAVMVDFSLEVEK